MISLSTLYTKQHNLELFLMENHFDLQSECLVRIYTAICTPSEAVKIAMDTKAVLPNAKIIGNSGSGIIFQGKQYDEHTLVIIEKFDHTSVDVQTYTFEGKSALEVATEVVSSLQSTPPELMHVLCGNHYYDVNNFVEEFNNLNTSTKLSGGVAGDILPKNIASYVFTEDGCVDKGIVIAALYNNDLFVFNEVNIAHEAISPTYKITQVNGSLLEKIEGTSAIDWCREQFGMENFTEYNDWQLIAENDALVHFPIVLEGHNGASRFIKYDSNTKKMSIYFSQLNVNTTFRIAYTSPTKCAQECFDICSDISQTPIESIFCYTCLFRKLYLGNCADWELKPFGGKGISGVFMMGEISYSKNRNEFLNGSSCFVGIAEKETYLSLDFNVFEDLYKIKDDNKALLNFVLQKQGAAMSRENQKLLDKLLQQQEKAAEQLYFDTNTGIPNTIKFAQDNQIYHFDKMCMIQIENSPLLISRFGQEQYYNLLRQAAEKVRDFTQSIEKSNYFFYYILNDSTLFITAGSDATETYFMEIINTLYAKFQFIILNNKDELIINRFVIVLNESSLLEKGLSTLQSNKNLQTHFLIYDASPSEHHKYLSAEMNMLHILNHVIENKRVIPYLQGIYDNEKKEINKYEALMRIEDEAGNIHAPYAFMDIAKKYHLYSDLSRIMLEKVFSLYADTKIDVSINLSAYDINFDTMNEFIFNKLEEIKNASNFTFEILEDENFKDPKSLKSFINKARQYGVKIAIDDFGSGYSNFMEIAEIEPDFIKIDASIIKKIANNDINRKVLANIVFLGKQLDAKLIAEFVENEFIQNHLERFDIQYSQGYHFSKPTAYTDVIFKQS